MSVTRNIQAGSLAISNEDQETARDVRQARRQAVGDAGVQPGAIPDTTGLEPSGRGDEPIISSFCRQRHVPELSATLRHLIRGKLNAGDQ